MRTSNDPASHGPNVNSLKMPVFRLRIRGQEFEYLGDNIKQLEENAAQNALAPIRRARRNVRRARDHSIGGADSQLGSGSPVRFLAAGKLRGTHHRAEAQNRLYRAVIPLRATGLISMHEQICDESCPSGLMRGAVSTSVVTIEIFVKEQGISHN